MSEETALAPLAGAKPIAARIKNPEKLCQCGHPKGHAISGFAKRLALSGGWHVHAASLRANDGRWPGCEHQWSIRIHHWDIHSD
jgi:hypothetical protein